MNIKKGEFICPKCGLKEMGGYTNWLNKITYNYIKEEETYWIFYKKTISWEKKCKSSYKCGWPFSKVDEAIQWICCLFLLLAWILYSVLYVLIISWIDIIKYCCCKNDTYKYEYSYIDIDTKIKQGEKISKDDENCIWSECEGSLECLWIRYGNSLFQCNNCKWKSKTFKDFIGGLKKTDIEIVKVKNISVIFRSPDQFLHYSIVCNLDNTFEDIVNELFKEYPNYKEKEIYFLLNGITIQDKNKTLLELGIKNSDNILICENTLDQSTANVVPKNIFN